MENFKSKYFYRHFTFIALFFQYFRGFSYRVLSDFLRCIFSVLSSISNIRVEFFFVGNFSVTAMFLSRYLCKKLSHGYRIRELMRPIRKELHFISRRYSGSINRVFNTHVFGYSSLGKFYRKGIVKMFILKFFYVYKKLFLKFFFYNKS
jgi:hypothetical protein